jgi:hypothetical protein
VFTDKRLGIALIVASIVWLILYTLSRSLFPDALFLVFWRSVLFAIVLVIIGIREIRWSKERQTGSNMVGLADIALAAFLLLFVARYYYYSYYEYSFYNGVTFVGALYILSFIALGITVTLFILVAVNKRKVGQRTVALWVVIVLLTVVFLAYTLDFLYYSGIVIAYLVLSVALIVRAVDLFPRRPRVVRAVGAPARGSAAGGNPLDAPSGGFAALCFFIPLVGLILYLVWKDEYPLKARSCGKGALIGVIVYFGLSCLSVVLAVVVPMMLMF